MKARIESLPDIELSHRGIVVSSENEEEAEVLQNIMDTGGAAIMLARDDKGTVEITIAPPAVPDEK